MIYEPMTRERASSARAALLAWSLWAVSVALVALGAVLLATNPSTGAPDSLYWLNNAVAALAFSTVGAAVAARRRENPIGWLFIAAGLLDGLVVFADGYGAYALSDGSGPAAEAALWLASWLWVPGGLLVMYTFLIFPDGRLPSPRWRAVAWLVAGVVSLASVSLALSSGPFGEGSEEEVPGLVGFLCGPLLGASALACIAALFARFRRARGEERQQLKWVAYAAGVMLVAVVTSSVSQAVDESLPGRLLFLAGFLALPSCIGVAVLRYRLWEIDFIINRTLVYGVLTACVVGIYALVVGYLGAVFQAYGSPVVSLVAAGIVAVLFAPLRDRLQRIVNRLMYGGRNEPYEVLSRLGRRLEATLAPGAVLPVIVETIVQALKLPYAAIMLRREDGFETAVEYGASADEPLVLPLTYGTETVGRLVLAPRAPGEPFTPADHRLLGDLARQVGVAAHAVRLTADLQRSRERLVAAREEERRRLRRDLHDGVGPQLAALTLKLETARNLLSHDPAAGALLTDLAERARVTVTDVRRAVHALRPPALDELGLIPALREGAAQYSQNGLRVSVEAPEGLPPLPAAVEVAAYRIAQEAMANAVRHAGASTCAVRFVLDVEAGLLGLEIRDDGRGILSGERGMGVGLSSMRERAEELGGACVVEPAPAGGTRVRARLPCFTESTEIHQ